MRALVTADLHLSSNPRDGYRHLWVDRFIKLARKLSPDLIILLGDLTEQKDCHPAALVNDVVTFVYELSKICPVIGTQGNHDYVADPENGFWPFLSCIKNVKWITKPEADVFGFKGMLYLPHTRNYQQDWAGVNLSGWVWIFAHNTFEGASSEHGFRLPGIPTEIFPPGAQVLSGDIHRPQVIGPVTYVGAPYLCDFGDDYKPRILQLDDDKKTSIPCPGAQKRLVTIHGPEELKLQKHVHPGDIVKVRVELAMKERERWPEIQAEVRRWAQAEELILHAVQPKFQLTSAGRAPLEPENKRSDEDTLKQYAALRKVSAGVLAAGMEFL